MRNKTLWTTGILAGILLSGVAFAQAQTAEQRETLRLVREQKNQSIDKCETIGRNLDKRMANFETSMKKHVTQYQKTENRVTALVSKLEGEGYDVSAIRVDLVEFESKIAKFETDYSAYVAQLEGTREFACDRSSAEFKAKLAIARAQLKIVHDDAIDIRTFWAKTIKPKIVELKTQNTGETTTETTTVEEGTE